MSYVGEFLRDREKRIFVEEEGEQIIGFCGAAKYNRDTGTIGYGVAVLPAFRRKGIGSMLLLTAFNWLKKADVRFVTLEEETFGFVNKDTPAIFPLQAPRRNNYQGFQKRREGLALFKAV